MNVRVGLAFVGVALLALASACSDGRQKNPTDGGLDAPGDNAGDRGPMGTLCVDAGTASKAMGLPCGCNNECQSNFCVDGVCCNSACQESCKACNVPATVGTCSFVPSGLKPRSANTCAMTEVATCGQDGTCDGKGACRKYPLGTTCMGGQCEGDAVTGINVCDGMGRCRPGAAKVCAPFSCDAAKKDCFPSCTKNTDCVSGVECVKGSCGPKMKAAVCAKNEECASGFCVDGVCCSVACQGDCVSCNLVGHEGTCWPIDLGNPDPHQICKDTGAAGCGDTGTCDGFGACAKYAAETVCIPPACTGDKLSTPGTCDGAGSCREPGVANCPPFRCVNGACNSSCNSDSDCVAGIACVKGTCGPKQNGQICKVGTECQSGNCVDGVCCADACTGGCRSCALPSSLGKCTPIADGNSDTRNSCSDQGAPSCGTDGKCDGAGGCRKYRPGTVCAGEKCASNVYTGPSTCNSTGQCTPPASRPCAPFACNGQRCFDACSNNNNCIPPNVCNGNSCGKKINGADCSNAAECASNECWQGVCCGTTCRNPCKSCALPGTEGSCQNVAASATDPANTCVDQGAGSCGTNGRCAGGACQRYAAGTSCKNPTCPSGSSMFTGRSTCDGSGNCNTPTTTSCFPFRCGTNACRSACAADGDCADGAVCLNGSCGLKPKGASCGQSSECSAGLVCSAKNVCCDKVCDGPCVSCTLSANPGTCLPVAAGQKDPNGKCGVSGADTCGNDGMCDGNSGCRKYPAGTQCVPPSCPANMSTLTLAKTCNGSGSCNVGGGTRTCGPYMCNGGTACNDTCTKDSECVFPPNSCVNFHCGRKPAGAPCRGDPAECAMGLSCTDGVCCNSPNCGDCKVCDSSGTCQSRDTMSCKAPDMCHTAGMCVAGACNGSTVITCTPSDQCHEATCNPMTGCVNRPKAEGAACNDGNPCTPTDTCQAGACKGTGTLTCTQPADQCHEAACIAMVGCVTRNKANNTACNDGNACTPTDTCQTGVCKGTGTLTCTQPSNPCLEATCVPATGCGTRNKTDGTSCNDGSACTQTDSCLAGVCKGSNLVSCPAPQTCHGPGVCNPTDGTCSTPALSNTPCDDGNKCTRTDTCQAGACIGSNPVACGTPPACHGPGVCDQTSGSCSFPVLSDGTTCDDGNACTRTDSCQTGTCQGSNPVVCIVSDQCHVAGTCNSSTGTCSNPAAPPGTGCDDQRRCTRGDSCNNGTCTGSAVTCMQRGQCQLDGACDEDTGQCVYPSKNNGTPCDDGDACTDPDVCSGGACKSGGPVMCQASDQCHDVGTCDSARGCSNPPLPNGTTCTDGNMCTENDICESGSCKPGSDRVCGALETCLPAVGCTLPNMSI